MVKFKDSEGAAASLQRSIEMSPKVRVECAAKVSGPCLAPDLDRAKQQARCWSPRKRCRNHLRRRCALDQILTAIAVWLIMRRAFLKYAMSKRAAQHTLMIVSEN